MGKMKKYKGHTIIELKDPETGEVVKRVESDNMFTNAINKMVAQWYSPFLVSFVE